MVMASQPVQRAKPANKPVKRSSPSRTKPKKPTRPSGGRRKR
jgi:hypothetical protein